MEDKNTEKLLDLNIKLGSIDYNMNFLKKIFFEFICRKVELNEKDVKTIQEYSEKGSIVFTALENYNFALYIFYWMLLKKGLKPPVFALEYSPILLQPFSFIFKKLSYWFEVYVLRMKNRYILDSDFIEKTLSKDKSIIFPLISSKYFLKRYIEKKYDFIIYLIELQKKREEPIFLIPQTIFWNRSPERTDLNFFHKIIRNETAIFNVLTIATPSFVHLMKPVNLKEEISKHPDLPSDILAINLRREIIENYQKEKRLVLGPIQRHRNEMMEKVLYHPNIINIIDKLSAEEKISKLVLKKNAYKYYKEIASDFSIGYIQFFESILEWILKKLFRGIVYTEESMEKIREASKKGTLVLTPCHKSHMDYLILSYLFYKNKIVPPHIAAGVNLSFFPLGKIFRHCGAFFIRRTFKGLTLYTHVFKQYIKMLIQESYPIEFFIEGGRTRTGRLLLPKQGMLSYLIEAVDEGFSNDISIVPISISYDRVLEEKAYEREIKGKEKEKENVTGVVKSTSLLKKNWGRVYLNVDTPFTLREIEKDGFKGNDRNLEISKRIIQGINRVTYITPISLVTSSMLLQSSKGFTAKDISESLGILAGYLSTIPAPLTEPISDKSKLDQMVYLVINNFIAEGIIENAKVDEGEILEDLFILKEDNRVQIAFYKNAISNFFLAPCMISISLMNLSKNQDKITIDKLTENFKFLKDLLSFEYIFPDSFNDANTVVKNELDNFFGKFGLISYDNDEIKIPAESSESHILLARILLDLVESYYIVLSVLSTSSDKYHSQKDLKLDIRKAGVKMYARGEIRVPESLSMPNYNTALKLFEKMGLLTEEQHSRHNIRIHISDRQGIQNMLESLKKTILSLRGKL